MRGDDVGDGRGVWVGEGEPEGDGDVVGDVAEDDGEQAVYDEEEEGAAVVVCCVQVSNKCKGSGKGHGL